MDKTQARYPIFLFGLLLILVIARHWEAFFAVAEEWGSVSAYSHGWLGCALAFYVLYANRKRLQECPYASSWLAGVAAVGSALVLTTANLINVQQAQLIAVFAVLFFGFWACFGRYWLRESMFFWLIMLFSLPVWHFLQPVLREMSTSVSVAVVHAMGVELVRQEYRLITQGGIFDVEPACSGLGFFLVAALFSVWVSYINRLNLWQSVRFFLLALCVALVANWLRIVIIILVGNATHMQHIIVQDHLSFGWVVFALSLLPLIWLARGYSQRDESQQKVRVSGAGKNYHALPAILLLGSLLVIEISGYLVSNRDLDEHRLYSRQRLTQDSGKVLASGISWWPSFRGASSSYVTFYPMDDALFQVLTVNYTHQRQGQELIYVENSLFSTQHWQKLEEHRVRVGNPEVHSVNLLHLKKREGRERLIAYWYVIGDEATTGSWKAKLAQLKAIFQGRPGASLLAVALDIDKGERMEAQHKLVAFINTLEWQNNRFGK